MLNSGFILDKKYEVIKVLGQGGMGTVYLCRNIRLENLWAIKEIKKDLDNLSEVNILKQLNHPGIPRIVDIFYDNNYLYMVQDFIDGKTLKEYVKEKGLMESENISRIVSSICDIIGYLHSLNPPIIYRDLKPSNIMIMPNGKVVLIDFGISKIYKENKNNDTVCAGSNGYAAPEQYGFGQSCKQTDIYALGMVIYYMSTGKISSTGLEPLVDDNYDKNIDVDLKRIIQKCVQVDIKDRYSSMEELNHEIIELLNKNKYTKTLLLNNSNIKMNSSKKNIPVKKPSKAKLKRSIIGFMLIMALAFAVVYNLSSSEKKDKETNIIGKPQVSNAPENLENNEKSNANEPVKDSNIKSNTDNNIKPNTDNNIKENNNINSDNNLNNMNVDGLKTDEKKNLKPNKGKEKLQENKNIKNKHFSDNNDDNND